MTTNKKGMRRVAILATLGAEIYRLGIGYDDRNAWRGLLEMCLDDFRAMITRIEASEKVTVGAVLAGIVTRDLGALGDFGQAALFQRQTDAYHADCANWNAQSNGLKAGSWRSKPPTREQRMLMIRMSHSLAVSLPGEVNRGQAADWIAAQGGNPRFSKEA